MRYKHGRTRTFQQQPDHLFYFGRTYISCYANLVLITEPPPEQLSDLFVCSRASWQRGNERAEGRRLAASVVSQRVSAAINVLYFLNIQTTE